MSDWMDHAISENKLNAKAPERVEPTKESLDALINEIDWWVRLPDHALDIQGARNMMLGIRKTILASQPERVEKLNRVELRPDDNGDLDDLVIDNVSMVHMERMDKKVWWIGLYFGPSNDRVTFDVRATKKDGLTFHLIETPETRHITGQSLKGASE